MPPNVSKMSEVVVLKEAVTTGLGREIIVATNDIEVS